jgi:hypothetical protein
LFLFLRGTPGYPMWSIVVTLGLVFGFGGMLAWANWAKWTSMKSQASRLFWSIRLSQILGMAIVPLISWQLARPELPWDPLTVYPYWAVVTGMTFFTFGGNFWGGLYLAGLAFFLLALLMPWNLEWAPVEFGFVVSIFLMAANSHLRRQEAKSRPAD